MEDTFTMQDVEAMQPEMEAPQDEPTTEKEAAASESSTNFIDKFKEAKSGDSPKEEEEPKQEATPEETKVEAEPEDSSRSAKDFKLLKEERDQARQSLAEMEKKLSDLKDNNVDEVLEKLKQERDALSDQLKTAALERHPDFIKQFDGKIDQVVSTAKATVGEHNEERIERLLRMEESEMRNDGLEQIFAELSPTRQAKLGAMLAQIDAIKAERAGMLSNQADALNELNAKYDQQQQERLKNSDAAWESALSQAKQHVEVFQKKDGDDEWNNGIDSMVTSARGLFSGEGATSLEEMARATLWAAAAPRLRSMLNAEREKTAKLEAALASGNNSNPSLSGSPSGEAKAGEKTFAQMFGEASGFNVSQ